MSLEEVLLSVSAYSNRKQRSEIHSPEAESSETSLSHLDWQIMAGSTQYRRQFARRKPDTQ